MRPGCCSAATAPASSTSRAEGDPLRGRVGPPRGRGGLAVARPRRVSQRAGDVRRRAARLVHLARPARGAQHAPGVRRGLLARGGPRRACNGDEGSAAAGDRPTERDAEHEIFSTDRAASYPAPDGKLTFDKLSSVFLSGNRTRDDQPNHIRIETQVPRELAELWARMCPAQVYELEPGDDGLVKVKVAPRTASSAARSPPRAAASPRPRAARAPSTRSPKRRRRPTALAPDPTSERSPMGTCAALGRAKRPSSPARGASGALSSPAGPETRPIRSAGCRQRRLALGSTSRNECSRADAVGLEASTPNAAEAVVDPPETRIRSARKRRVQLVLQWLPPDMARFGT